MSSLNQPSNSAGWSSVIFHLFISIAPLAFAIFLLRLAHNFFIPSPLSLFPLCAIVFVVSCCWMWRFWSVSEKALLETTIFLKWLWADQFFTHTHPHPHTTWSDTPGPHGTLAFIFQTELNSKWQTFLPWLSKSKFSPYRGLDVIWSINISWQLSSLVASNLSQV